MASLADRQTTTDGFTPAPLAAFLTDPITSRDLFGICRGRCRSPQCDCGIYQKLTSDYTISPEAQVGRRKLPLPLAAAAAAHAAARLHVLLLL